MSTDGNRTALRAGQTESDESVGDAGLVPGCATHPRAAICVEAGVVRWLPYFALSETCRARTCGSLTCTRRPEKLRGGRLQSEPVMLGDSRVV